MLSGLLQILAPIVKQDVLFNCMFRVVDKEILEVFSQPKAL
jgi:hypothetical protein